MADYFSMYCNIYINGVELDEQRYRSITDVTLDDPIEGSSTVTLSITDTDSIFIEDNIFIEDTPIKVKMGINELGNEWGLEGYITAIDLDFPDNGDIRLILTCSDNSHRMNRMKRTVTWENKRNVDIAGEIAASYGFKFVIINEFSFKFYDSIAQDDKTDLEFIEQLRDEEVFPSYAKMLDAETFSFQTITFNKPTVCDLHYRLAPFDVVNFTPSINRAQLQEGMLKSEISVQSKIVETAQATFDYASALTNGELPVTSSRPASSSYNYGGQPLGGYTQGGDTYRMGERSEKLFTEAEKELLKQGISTMTGSLTLRPNENNVKIKPGDTVNIFGLGKYLSGMYLVSNVSISLSSKLVFLDVVKTGFGDSVKSSTLYMETPDPNYVPPSDSSSSSGSSGTPSNLDSAEHTTLQFTAYTHTGNNTASGVYPTPHHTCASWDDLPFGTQIYVPAMGETYTVEDRGGAVTYGIIDIFMDTEQECWDFGRQDLEAYIIRM